MPDITKRLERAEKYLHKGKPDAALEEYLEALREDPNNQTVRQNAADLCVSVGRTEDARRLMLATFEHYSSAGDSAVAAAAFKKLARLGAPPVTVVFRYAQLVEKSNPKEAVEAYRAAVAAFAKSGDNKRALQAMRQLVQLEPSLENLVREGTLAAETGEAKCASVAFLRVAMLEDAAGTAALPWYERAYQMDPGHPEVALAFGQALLKEGEAARAAEVLSPIALSPNASSVAKESYGRALLADQQLVEAEPFLWQLFEADPNTIQEVESLIGALLDSGENEQAVALSRKLEKHQRRAGNYKEFVSLMRSISEKYVASVSFLEYLAEVYDSANREQDYCATLIQLFELYFAAGNFLKAASSLDRAAEVDAYEPGHERRLEMLRGKIDASRFNTVAGRLSGVMKVEQQEAEAAPESGNGGGESTVLEDLMLQAEIFLQYSMRTKALERLERIHKLFPREEEKDPKLRELFLNAGFAPQYPGGAAPQPAVEEAAAPASAPVASPPAAAPDVDNFARVNEITRNIYRQGNVKGVLFTAVNDVGRHWNASRCVAGLLTPGKPPSSALEYCAPGVPQSEIIPLVKLVMACQAIAVERGTVSILEVASAREFDSVRSYIEPLRIRSLLAVPLLDGDGHAGILILQQCDKQRQWRSTDIEVLKTIAEQMILAVNNAKLRSLVRTLAVTEEKSGLLKRSSYLDVLLSEVKRALEQQSTCTVLLMHFGKSSALVREVGEAAVEAMMEEIGQMVASHIRQNDVAVRYELTTVALILADTSDKNSFFVVDKLRRLLAGMRLPGRSAPPSMTAGIAEAIMNKVWDPVDVVTEVINRAEAALDAAKSEGGNKARSLTPQIETTAAGV